MDYFAWIIFVVGFLWIIFNYYYGLFCLDYFRGWFSCFDRSSFRQVAFYIKHFEELRQNYHPTGGKMDEESMMAFMKEMKNSTELTDEEIAALAAAKIQDNKPKSRM